MTIFEGDCKAGREYSDRDLEVSPLDPQLLLPRVMLEHETGEFAQGEVYLERLLQAMHRPGPNQLFWSARGSTSITAIARITGVPDRLEIAEAAAKAVLSEQSVTPRVAMYAKADLALLAVQKGDQSAAEEHYPYVREQRSTMIATVSSVDRLPGLLSAGKRVTGPSWPGPAATMLTLYSVAGPGDREKGMSLLDEALAISRELGMRPLMERVLSRRDILKA